MKIKILVKSTLLSIFLISVLESVQAAGFTVNQVLDGGVIVKSGV